jgi:hypothetical protein
LLLNPIWFLNSIFLLNSIWPLLYRLQQHWLCSNFEWKLEGIEGKFSGLTRLTLCSNHVSGKLEIASTFWHPYCIYLDEKSFGNYNFLEISYELLWFVRACLRWYGIACDTCEVWQHTRCCGIDDSETFPLLFVCSNCLVTFSNFDFPATFPSMSFIKHQRYYCCSSGNFIPSQFWLAHEDYWFC